MKTVRIGCGQGFWGDSLTAPLDLVRRGPLDFLVLDYLAEVTMSILARHRQKNPRAGYARDFVELIEQLLPELVEKGVVVLANAGGMNPLECGRAIVEVAKRTGFGALRVGVVEGDDISGRIDELLGAGEALAHLETGAPIADVRAELRSANVYLGAEPLVEALRQGAQIVVSGRVADPALVLAPLIHSFNWPLDDWNRLASGIVAGHIIECGAQCSGGNCSADWESIPALEDIGYPIVECREDGSFVVTKHPNTGGRVDERSVKEQLVYEIGDPRSYITPDVIADFTSLSVRGAGPDRVEVSGVTGRARPERLKASLSYFSGYSASGTMLYSWPKAREKAERAGEIVRRRLDALGLRFDKVHTEIIGANACHGAASDSPAKADPAEAMLRVAVRGRDEKSVERFTREIAPLVLNGPPSATAYFGARGAVHDIVAYWPTLVSRSSVSPTVTILGGDA